MKLPPQKSESVALGEFSRLCKEIFEQRRKIDLMVREQKRESDILEEMKAKVLAHMEQAEIEKANVPGYGTLFTKVNFSVRVPQGDNKAAFFDYLKKIDVFEDMATVNSATLNSWYREKMDEAIEKGDVDFKIPGIEEPKAVKTLMFRSA